jgi:hypothetical protein
MFAAGNGKSLPFTHSSNCIAFAAQLSSANRPLAIA